MKLEAGRQEGGHAVIQEKDASGLNGSGGGRGKRRGRFGYHQMLNELNSIIAGRKGHVLGTV